MQIFILVALRYLVNIKFRLKVCEDLKIGKSRSKNEKSRHLKSTRLEEKKWYWLFIKNESKNIYFSFDRYDEKGILECNLDWVLMIFK